MRVVDPTSTLGAMQLNVTSDLKMKLRPSLCPLVSVPVSPQNLAAEAKMWNIADMLSDWPTNPNTDVTHFPPSIHAIA